MRKTLRVCFLLLALLMTVFGWNVSKPAVLLVWTLLCLEEVLGLQQRENKKPVPHYRAYKLCLLAAAAACLGLAAVLQFAG